MKLLRAGLLFAVLALTACPGGTAPQSAVKASTSTATPAHTNAATAEPDPTGPLPPRDAPREAASPDPNFDFGYVVQITARGFHPQWLVSGCCRAVTWKNLTGAPVSVVFDHQLVDSGPIPPGGSFTFTPHNVQSIAYHAGGNPSMIGVLQVNQMFES